MNRLAEVAQQEACKSFHGKIMVQNRISMKLLNRFRNGVWKRPMPCGVLHLSFIAAKKQVCVFHISRQSAPCPWRLVRHGRNGQRQTNV